MNQRKDTEMDLVVEVQHQQRDKMVMESLTMVRRNPEEVLSLYRDLFEDRQE